MEQGKGHSLSPAGARSRAVTRELRLLLGCPHCSRVTAQKHLCCSGLLLGGCPKLGCSRRGETREEQPEKGSQRGETREEQAERGSQKGRTQQLLWVPSCTFQQLRVPRDDLPALASASLFFS